MPARNVTQIGKSRRVKPIPGHVWIPPTDGSIYKIEIVTSSQTYDVTDFILQGELIDGVTETIGSFNFEIDNSAQQYANAFSIYDTLNVYMNYGATATILKFSGLIERPSNRENKIILTGKGSALRAVGKNVTHSATDVARSDVLIAIIEKYFTGVITTTNVETDSTLITVNYEDKPFWEIVEEMCAAGGRDAYIDPNFDFHYFESGSRVNITDAAVHESNLVDTGDFSPDLQGVINKVRVYGQKNGKVIIVGTAEDTTSQTNLSGDIRELIINDNSIITTTQAQDRADFELAKNKDPPTVGEVKALLMPTLSPGEKVRISDPLNGIDPAHYTIQNYRHNFSNDEPPMTTLTIQKERSSIPLTLKQRVRFDTDITEPNNPGEMDYSIIFDFSNVLAADADAFGTHSDTEIDSTKGFLKVVDGGTTGTWISDVVTAKGDITDGEARIEGTSLKDLSVFISLDAGQSYTQIGFNNFVSGGTATAEDGDQVRLKLVLGSANVEVSLAGVLYKI